MKITIHTFCHNEARLVPYFLRHYDASWVEKIVVYDDASEDDSVALLAQSPLVEIRPFGRRPNQPLNDRMVELRDAAVGEARKKRAPWLLVPDFDEFLWHENIPAFLQRCHDAGHAVVRPYGWNMVHPYFPRTEGKITDEVTRGYPHYLYSKPILLRPDLVHKAHFHGGAHHANPRGKNGEHIYIHNVGSAKILHFRYLGWPYYWGISREREARHTLFDPVRRGGMHYEESFDKRRKDFALYLRDAVDLIT